MNNTFPPKNMYKNLKQIWNFLIEKIKKLKILSNLYTFSNRKNRKLKLTKLDPTKLKKNLYMSQFLKFNNWYYYHTFWNMFKKIGMNQIIL